MLVYVLIDNMKRICFSAAPEVDKLFLGIDKFLYPGLPLSSLQRYLRLLPAALSKANTSNREDRKDRSELEKEVIKRVQKGLNNDGSMLRETFVWQESWKYPSNERTCEEILDEDVFTRFIEIVAGRQTAEGEFPFLAKKLNLNEEKLIRIMQKAVIMNRGEWLPSLAQAGSDWRCSRCGSDNYEEWPSLYGRTVTCEDCKSIGPLNSLQVIFRFKPDKFTSCTDLQAESNPGQAWEENFEFTSAQKRVAVELCGNEVDKEVLVWAACGAGKTEVCFPLIRSYLNKGRNVLFAAPRQDVVHDVQPRFQKHFPQYSVRILSGAITPELEKSQFTVATTHQVLRFYRAFDLIILDEMDAYPYIGNKVLEYGLKQALREDGRLIYLTATPSEEVLQKVAEKKCALLRLPGRYHGQPVPVPEFVKLKLPENHSTMQQIMKHSCLAKVRIIFGDLAQQGPLLVFVPTIEMVSRWVIVLRDIFKDKLVDGSWGSDPERRRKVLSFIAGGSDIFVCTSILERGITVNGVQVAILYAQHDLYDVRILVQMAGRVGRTAQYPGGRAVLIAPKETKPITNAIQWVKEQNALAGKGDFLNVQDHHS